MPLDRPLRLGTRGSALARWQAEWVAAQLTAAGNEVELVPITTQGDVLRTPLGEAGGVGLFTKELQNALLDGRIDLAVHSLKDLPTDPAPGLSLAATPPRESVCDVLLCREPLHLHELKPGAVVGTGSLRRRAQMLALRPDLRTADIRGNLDTRIRKLLEGEFDAIVLAEAGLKRLGLMDRATQIFTPLEMLPAVGQGALGIETRADDDRVRRAVAVLNDPATFAAVTAERALLAHLRGGCLAPVGAWGRIEASGALELGALKLDAIVLSADGARRITAHGQIAAGHADQAAGGDGGSFDTAADGAADSAAADAAELGREVGDELIALGASLLISESRAAR